MRALATAARGKGARGLIRRLRSVSTRYDFASGRMAHSLERYSQVLRRFGCPATFPVTATTLARSKGTIERCRDQGIEIAVHGYRHVDHTRFGYEEQREQLERARKLFHERGIEARGFRAPYLRWNPETVAAVTDAGFLYDASPAIAWDLDREAGPSEYRTALAFYGALSAEQRPSLPRWDGLIRIPYCLPDDEALVERLHRKDGASMAEPWLHILERTHQLGELFTLGLHPERFFDCEEALATTLRRASALTPHVWMARLDAIAQWWAARTTAEVSIEDLSEGLVHIRVRGPDGVTVLARGVDLKTQPVTPWDGPCCAVQGRDFHVRSLLRPFIGLSPSSSPRLATFLRQQGFIVEEPQARHEYGLILDRREFAETDERALLSAIERSECPLIRLGRWPHGAKSALCVTGDIDCLTLWDYATRVLPGLDNFPHIY